MNRWIRGKEIKAEAEWTAQWVFRYDKSPRKSPFPFRLFFSVFSVSLPHSVSCILLSLPYLVASFSRFLFLPLIFFFNLLVLAEKEVARLFDCWIDVAMRRSREWKWERHLAREFLFDSRRGTHFQLGKWVARLTELRDIPATDRFLLACRFKVVIKIVNSNTSGKTASYGTFEILRVSIYGGLNSL